MAFIENQKITEGGGRVGGQGHGSISEIQRILGRGQCEVCAVSRVERIMARINPPPAPSSCLRSKILNNTVVVGGLRFVFVV